MNVLLVDDMHSVVNGISNGIDWKRLDIHQVYKAYNAYEARALLNNVQIDILLTDIEMPGESGIELINWIRETRQDIECIILSSHANFTYAQQAIKSKSYAYLVLPCEYAEIEASVAGAVQKITENRKQKELSLYGKKVTADKWIQRQLFSNCIQGIDSEISLNKMIDTKIIEDGNIQGVLGTCAVVREDIGLDSWEKHLMEFALDNVFREILEPFDTRILFCELSLREYAFFCFPVKLEYHIFEQQMAIIKDLLFSSLKLDVQIKSVTCKAIQLKDKYETLHYHAGSDHLVKNRTRGYHNYWMKFYEDAPVSDMPEELRIHIETDRYMKNQYERVAIYSDLVQLMYKYLDKYRETIFDLFKTQDMLTRYINSHRSIYEILWFAEQIAQYAVSRQPIVEMKREDPVALIIDYVEENIEKDIKRSELADYVHLNIDYISRIFKKETGLTINEYINQQKMKTARQLLRNTKLPVSLIASRIGYSDFSYFSRLYKKTYQKTPGEDRE